jgi:dipeptidyl aminopeptidase/acylaminoacyl peptidase
VSVTPEDAGLSEPGVRFEPEDLYRFRAVTSIHGVWKSDFVAAAVKSVSAEEDTYTSAVWMFPCGGGDPWKLTSGKALDNQPRVAPDGARVAFLSDRDGSSAQVYVIEPGRGEAQQVGDFDHGVVAMRWHPGSRKLLALVDVRGDKCNGERASPQRVWRLPYKLDGSGFTLDRETHLFTLDASSGDATRLTYGAIEVRSADWSPDGERIAFVRNREARLGHRTDLWVIDANGDNCRQLTDSIAAVQSPAWSPDGRWIAFTGSERDGDALTRLWLFDVEGAKVSPLGDESIEVASGGELLWSQDSSRVYFLHAHRGRQHIGTVSIPDGKIASIVTGDRQVSGLAFVGERLAFYSQSPATLNELFTANRDGSDERQVSDLNAWWRAYRCASAEMRTFEVPDGSGGVENVEGWYFRPRGAGGALPLLVDVHGGPASYALLAFHSHVYWHALCARGWSVLALNAVGSSSYGRDFATRLNKRWGELDLPQFIAAVESLQREGLADLRVAITGKSYGGYLAAWAIGHTDMFRAAVVSAPVANLQTHFGTSDSGYYADPYVLCAMPFHDREVYWRLSPVRYAHNARTPTLILQGADDQRCPLGQSEELFVSLMCAGETPAEMVIYPKGGHHFFEDGKPSHRLDAVRRLVQWCVRWIDVPVEDRAANSDDQREAAD